MRKILLVLILFAAIAIFLPKEVSAQSCLSGGKNGTCSSSANCDSSTSTWVNIGYSPVNVCLGSGGGCCVPKTTGGGSQQQSPTCSTKGKTGIDTAIGCIPISDTNAFMGFILGWAIGIGGGIAFLLIVVAGFQIMTSTGNPERLKAGQELLTSAIAGLIMIIFSVFILQIIGVTILKLPGFGK